MTLLLLSARSLVSLNFYTISSVMMSDHTNVIRYLLKLCHKVAPGLIVISRSRIGLLFSLAIAHAVLKGSVKVCKFRVAQFCYNFIIFI